MPKEKLSYAKRAERYAADVAVSDRGEHPPCKYSQMSEADRMLQRVADMAAKLAEQIGQIEGRVSQIENDLAVVDGAMKAALEILENHAGILKALTQPARPAVKKVIN